MSHNGKFMMVPVNGNVVIEQYEYSDDVKEDMEEDTGAVLLPEEQQKKMDLDKDGIYRILSYPDSFDEGDISLKEGDLVVVPNRTVGDVILMNGQEVKYVHNDRIIMVMEKVDDY